MSEQKTYRTKLHRAMIVGKPDEAALRPLKDAGFDGVETTALLPEDEAKQCREIAERMGMRIHSVLAGWDPGVLEKALIAAGGFGADAVLIVPGRIGGMPMPEAWEWDIRFDPKTGYLKQVVSGDNAKYAAYIEAHDRATDQAHEAIKPLVPLAQKLKVAIAIENVWNNLWVKPDLLLNLVASFRSPWVKVYFDVGNHVKYMVPPEQWIRTFGKHLSKVHIKDFKLVANGHGGDWAHPRDGSVNWPAVRDALEAVKYNGWLTIEDGGLSLTEFRSRLDDIIAGK
jgi:hexulose-6-phosphate isomerase